MTTINEVVLGASVTMTAKEVEALCGNNGIRLVTCQNDALHVRENLIQR